MIWLLSGWKSPNRLCLDFLFRVSLIFLGCDWERVSLGILLNKLVILR